MKIPVTSPTIRRKEMDAVLSCMVSEKIGPGDLNQNLLQYIKETFKVDGCVAVRSPAIALKYILKACELPKECGVMISALAPLWQYQVVEELGYKPLVIDVSVDSALMTKEAIEEGIQNGGKVVLFHETLGNIPDFNSLETLGIPVIEDISQSAGASVIIPADTDSSNGEPSEKKAGLFGAFSILGLEEQDILTAGGGAVILAPNRKEWTMLKQFTDDAPVTDILPDINCALALVQLKERSRNEQIRKEMHDLYMRSLMQSRHKNFIKTENTVSAVYSFPVVLESGLKDVKQYVSRKEIDILEAFGKTVISAHESELENCRNAKSLLLRCVLFPLYPRLGMTQAAKIAKVLATLP